MIYALFDCPNCGTEVTAPANPDSTLPATGQVEERTVHCPKCKTSTVLEVACRIKGQKKKGRRKKESPAAPSDKPQTTDGETLGGESPK